ncbi:MAG TPA: Xaa-Pro peptidase family protein [Streptosporangiaceae bacterium]
MTSKEAEAKGGHVAQAEQARPVPAAPAQADAAQADAVQAGAGQAGAGQAGPVQAGVGHTGAGQAGAGQEADLAGLYPADRLGLAAAAAARAGIGALLLTPGPDLRYLTGYDALATERLTCLAVPADGPAFLVAPRLELRSVQASPAGGLGLDIVAWDETDDPYRLVADRLGRPGSPGSRGAPGRPAALESVGLADQMWAMMVLRFRDALPGARLGLASTALRGLRIRKTDAEVAALRQAGAAIDRVHGRVPELLRPGRTEREVAADIAGAIIAEGHARADFVIVGSGPNAARPHHEPSGRILAAGDTVVVDIGGTMPSGYCSDCTRTYAIGSPPPEVTAYYQVLQEAQEIACAAVRPGVSAEAVDAAAREPITAAGYGEYFVHRTGHGIGLETHEDPYIVSGNTEALVPGMAFSVEPGIYPGPHGARIEDIVVCTPDGGQRLNNVTRELVVVDA